MASSSSSFSRNWEYDVFLSFRGEDVRKTFLSHFLKELDRKLIKPNIDEKIERGQSLKLVLKQAIRTSRIAVVVFSENYASSSWCLDELVEIVNCKEELDQVVIPIFYGLDPTHVRKQIGKFGQVFAKTCEEKSENEIKLWRQSLTKVADQCGNHPQNWSNEAKMVEEIVDDIIGIILNLIPRKEFENFVGMEYHIAKMNALLDLKSEEVRMIGIWGSLGIGKTSIARTLYSQLSHRFQWKIFIDEAFVSNVMKKYENANPYDPNVKLHLVGSFLSEILDKRDIKIDSFDAMSQVLKHHKVLIFIDDLDHQEVLDTLVGQTKWFGCGSRIIVITEDKHFLRDHGIDYIYEVRLPSDELALKIFCKSAFGMYFPPDGLMEFASKIASSAGNLPLGLRILGSYVKGREKEAVIEMQPRLLKGLDAAIEKRLRVSYDKLNSPNDKALFCHIACFFNGKSVRDIKLRLADSNLDVRIALKNLVDKSLIHIRDGTVEMHSLLQNMGQEIVRAQSNESGEREFLVDAMDTCDLLENNTVNHQVFINFRGVQLRHNFVDHLTYAFKTHKIKFFIDTDELLGKDLQNLFVRIEESTIALAIFSTRYPESKWCMNELVKLKKRSDEGKLQVIPIFYKVDAGDVKTHKYESEFGKNFWRFAQTSDVTDPIQEWRIALECISKKMGLSLGDKCYEADFVQEIVKEVQRVIETMQLEKEKKL